MNFWVAKINGNKFTENNLDSLESKLNGFIPEISRFLYSTNHVHFASFFPKNSDLKKNYSVKNKKKLRSYSGLIVDPNNSGYDFRDANTLFRLDKSIEEIALSAAGQFAITEISETEFKCVVDAVGHYEVFYYVASTGEAYISNSVDFIQYFKGREINYQFFINWLTLGFTYGYETEEKEIFTLPENGLLTWNKGKGVSVGYYSTFSNLVSEDVVQEQNFKNLAHRYRNCANYLNQFHSIVIPLSGGYDSRLALEMFQQQDKSEIVTFTYPDQPEDLRIAKKIAKHHKIKHLEIQLTNDFPSIDELHNSVSDKFPFLSYKGVFSFLYNQPEQLYGWDKVFVRGNIAVHGRLKEHQYLNNIGVNESFNKLFDNFIDTHYLKKDTLKLMKKNFSNYYSNKYSDYLEQNSAVYLVLLHYFFEHFAIYQGYRYSCSRLKRKRDLYFPFACREFVKLAFSVSLNSLEKEKKYSLHHKLSLALQYDKISSYPFTSGLHWEANKWEKAKYYFRKKYLKSKQVKESRAIQLKFVEQHKNHLIDVVQSYPSSPLWNCLDRKVLINNLDDEKLNKSDLKLLLKLVPLLKENI